MKDLIVRLWPAEPIPSSFFVLVKRIGRACPRLDVIKRSVCIEGARMAFARAKVHIVEYLRNLLVQQAVIGNKWLSGRKYLREPKVSFIFSKII